MTRKFETHILTLKMPPPPTPWIVRPASIVAMLEAAAQMIEPMRNNRRATKITPLLPKMSARAAISGCTTALARRYEAAIQKADTASAPSAWATVCVCLVSNALNQTTAYALREVL